MLGNAPAGSRCRPLAAIRKVPLPDGAFRPPTRPVSAVMPVPAPKAPPTGIARILSRGQSDQSERYHAGAPYRALHKTPLGLHRGVRSVPTRACREPAPGRAARRFHGRVRRGASTRETQGSVASGRRGLPAGARSRRRFTDGSGYVGVKGFEGAQNHHPRLPQSGPSAQTGPAPMRSPHPVASECTVICALAGERTGRR